jgi:hypothetical protein
MVSGLSSRSTLSGLAADSGRASDHPAHPPIPIIASLSGRLAKRQALQNEQMQKNQGGGVVAAESLRVVRGVERLTW